jgi:acyl carrier protein
MKKRINIQSIPDIIILGMTVTQEGHDADGLYIILDDGVPDAVEISKKDNMTADDLYAKLISVIVGELRVCRSRVQREAQLKDICVDSIDFVELLMAVEDSFGISITDDEADKIHTVQDIFDCVKKKIASK